MRYNSAPSRIEGAAKLNRIEKAMMNNPLRATIQRWYEARLLKHLGGRLDGKRVLEIGCGRGRKPTMSDCRKSSQKVKTRMSVKERWWTLRAILTALLLSLLIFPTGITQAQNPSGIQTVAGETFRRTVDTPFKKSPRPIIGALREPLDKLPQIENFEVIGYNPLPNPGDSIARGRNGPIGIAGNCLYVGSRVGRRTGTGPAFGNIALPPEVLIVDISNPAKPEVVGALQTPIGATSRELRTMPDMNTLIIMNFRATGIEGGGGGVPDPPNTGAVNNYQIYNIANCRKPILVSTIGLDTSQPHEFFLWQDPKNPARFLLYSSFTNVEPSLRLFEIMNPPFGTIKQAATFTLTPAVPLSEPVEPNVYRNDHFLFAAKPTTRRNSFHAMSVSRDGTRVYMSSRQGGYFILDSSRLAANLPCTADTVTVDATSNADSNLCLRKINPDPNARLSVTPPYGGQHHSIYPVPGRPYLVAGGERNGTTTCPWTWGSILDMSDEKNLQIVSRYMVPENLEVNCFKGGPGDPALLREFSSHQPLIFPNIFFISWYSAGLRTWDISNPALPLEVGVFVPRPVDKVVERFRDSPDVWVWPFPILHNGLIYITDENSGLYVLRYTGPRADELPKKGTVISNTNF